MRIFGNILGKKPDYSVRGVKTLIIEITEDGTYRVILRNKANIELGEYRHIRTISFEDNLTIDKTETSFSYRGTIILSFRQLCNVDRYGEHLVVEKYKPD